MSIVADALEENSFLKMSSSDSTDTQTFERVTDGATRLVTAGKKRRRDNEEDVAVDRNWREMIVVRKEIRECAALYDWAFARFTKLCDYKKECDVVESIRVEALAVNMRELMDETFSVIKTGVKKIKL